MTCKEEEDVVCTSKYSFQQSYWTISHKVSYQSNNNRSVKDMMHEREGVRRAWKRDFS